MRVWQRLPLVIVCLSGCGPGGGSSTAEATETGSSGADTATTTPTTGASEESSGGTTGELAEGCGMPDPATRADFVLDLGDVPGATEFSVDLALECETTAVTVAGSKITSALSCLDDMGVPHPVVFAVASSDVGAPAWAAGEAVTLQVRGVQDFGGLLPGDAGALSAVEIAMHRGGGGPLLAAATQSYGVTAELYAPLQIAIDRDACGMDLAAGDPDFPGPDRDMGVRFTLGDAGTTLFSGQRGQLSADGPVLAIDVEEATASECCEISAWVVAIARLLTPA